MQEYGIHPELTSSSIPSQCNYAVNVWGPIQVPTKFDPYPKEMMIKQPTKAATTAEVSDRGKYVPPNRQMTFNWRGRREKLCAQDETLAENKLLRWHSWWDPVNKEKTSLLKFSFSQGRGMVVDSWAMKDEPAKWTKPDQQWTNYEE